MNYYMRSHDPSISTNKNFYVGSYLYKLKFNRSLFRLYIMHLDVCGYNCFDYLTNSLTLQDDLRMNEVHNWIKNNKWEI